MTNKDLQAIQDFNNEQMSNFDFLPAPVKALVSDVLYNSILKKNQDSRKLDESFFEKSDLNFIKNLVKEQLTKNPTLTKGNIEYKNYPSGTRSVERQGGSVLDMFINPEERVKKTLGQFGWQKDKDGSVIITDRFNFNDAPIDRQNVPLVEKLRTVASDIKHENLSPVSYGAVRKAAQHLGSPEGSGATFNINLGNLGNGNNTTTD
jgi:hypothetical protein